MVLLVLSFFKHYDNLQMVGFNIFTLMLLRLKYVIDNQESTNPSINKAPVKFDICDVISAYFLHFLRLFNCPLGRFRY